MNIRNASNFPGYCSSHDKELFEKIDSRIENIDEETINLQCLRALRRYKFENDLQKALADHLIDGLSSIIDDENETEYNDSLKSDIKYFSDKKEIMLQSRRHIDKAYDDIFNGIESNNYVLKYKRLDCVRTGWAMSLAIDFTLDKDEELAFIFLFKIDVLGEPVFFVAYFDNALAEEMDSYTSSLINVSYFLIDKKERIVFSEEFINGLSHDEKDFILKDNDLYMNDNNPINSLRMKRILLD